MIIHKDLPDWLKALIYNELGGSYEPDRLAFKNNLFSDEEKNKKYLGTYFPRSFTESYCIFSNLFDNSAYLETMKNRDSLSVLSFGCGSGGDLMGLLEAINEKMPWIKNLDFIAYDGNFCAMEMLKKVVEYPANLARFNIKPDYVPIPMDKPEDFGMYCSAIDRSFDFILTFKMVNEIYRSKIITTKPYLAFLNALASKISEIGVMLLLDVPLKENGENLPVLLSMGMREFLKSNEDYDTIVPISCYLKGRVCNERCYLRKVFYGDIFSSEKVSYCMLSRAEMAKIVCNGIQHGNYIVNDDNDYCKMIDGPIVIDAYNLKKN